MFLLLRHYTIRLNVCIILAFCQLMILQHTKIEIKYQFQQCNKELFRPSFSDRKWSADPNLLRTGSFPLSAVLKISKQQHRITSCICRFSNIVLHIRALWAISCRIARQTLSKCTFVLDCLLTCRLNNTDHLLVLRHRLLQQTSHVAHSSHSRSAFRS